MLSTTTLISKPTTALKGELSVPGDKSISHRALIIGAIAEGITSIEGFLAGEDCLATLKALQLMNVIIESSVDNKVKVHGVGKFGLQKPAQDIDCGNSGTSMRLLAGILAAQRFDSVLFGDASLQKRPMTRISTPLNLMGAKINICDGKPPISINASPNLHAITYQLPMASAQVKSAILLAGLYATGQTSVIEPEITRNHTEKMLETFGCKIAKTDTTITLKNCAKLQATHIKIPGDISSAAFFIVAATIIPDSVLLIKNVGINETRTGIIEILALMGADITILDERLYGKEPVADLLVRSAPLQGITIPIYLVPLAIDEFPVIFIAAAVAKGKTLLHGASELRNKESDRIGVMVEGLNNLNIKAKALADGVEIEGGILQGGTVDSYDDHRIAMAFAIAGAVAKNAVTIKNSHNVVTSFPSFVSKANSVNLLVEEFNE